jgi:hypothetical protein
MLPVLLIIVEALATAEINSEVDVTRDTLALADVGLAVTVLKSSLHSRASSK